ncbi:hypothetical protein GGP57_002159 [Salinibacter ruber]|uniref:hypothetical protein n=1 Tax=Salinibacter ruber TaxID=146919 RepID=UPI002169A160|nr:hypothetical protein [Salinibacter ruber]MCS3634826.1 hypothetical protein [Salinibacter ruber]MCS3714699.1 hypothetical protein [Salinibacter ruber]MCS4177322.1 hypothetical protein [Salinibacter ruber]
MTQFAFENLMPPGLTGAPNTFGANACGGHVRPEVKEPQAGPAKQEVFSVRKNPLDSSRGEVNKRSPASKEEECRRAGRCGPEEASLNDQFGFMGVAVLVSQSRGLSLPILT